MYRELFADGVFEKAVVIRRRMVGGSTGCWTGGRFAMIFKLVGALLITSGTAAWGLAGIRRLRRRAAVLRTLTDSFDLMENEITQRLTPMAELMELLSEAEPGPAGRFYGSVLSGMKRIGEVGFPIIWRRAAEDTPGLYLNEEERAALSELGLSLGRYDVEQQRSAIRYTRRRFDHFAERAAADRDRDSRVHAFLSVAAGILAVLVLI
jgi:stage III sporulation protein AB